MARCVFDQAQQCSREPGHRSACLWPWWARGHCSHAAAPALSQHRGDTRVAEGKPQARASSIAQQQGGTLGSCNHILPAATWSSPSPQLPACWDVPWTGTCSRLSPQNGLILLSMSGPSSQHTCTKDAPVPMSILCLCMDMQGSRVPGEHRLLPILPT